MIFRILSQIGERQKTAETNDPCIPQESQIYLGLERSGTRMGLICASARFWLQIHEDEGMIAPRYG